jgi:endonuclease/exonuclease/phosphatase family metal-dependent hydrolase
MAAREVTYGERGSPMTISAVTANLGCASPSAVGAERRAAADAWAQRARQEERPNLVFAQEVSDDAWLDAWAADGWQASEAEGPSYRVRSRLLWRDLEDLGPLELPTADYHGSYVSGRKLAIPGIEREVAVLSVHASPRSVTADELATWESLAERPEARPGGGPNDEKLYDADMVVATCRLLAADQAVLAVGDLNECLLWDEVHNERWGALFHERVTAGDVLELPLHALWGEERRTLFRAGHPPYQLDHVIATRDVARLVASAEVDSTWSEEGVAEGALSDHAPVRFSLG